MSTHNPILQQQINQLYDNTATSYDTEPGHGICDDERALWRTAIFAAIEPKPGSRVLDVGAGTGVFSQLFADWGCAVVGLEPSAAMVAQAQAKQAATVANPITYLVGDIHTVELFDAATFDFIVSRQVVCYFHDPLQVFENWRRWLKPGGQVVVVDGLWSRAGWGDEGLVDQLPLACLQTRATIAYLLEKSGFQVTHNSWLTQVNTYLQAAEIATAPRYMIVAQKSEPVVPLAEVLHASWA